MDNLIVTILTSLKIFFAYGAMKPGNILFPLRQFFDWALHWLPEKVDLYLRKPLYDCVFCMGSLWGMAFTTRYFALTIDYLFLLLQVAGLNYIIASILRWYHDQAEKEEDEQAHKEIEKKEDAATEN